MIKKYVCAFTGIIAVAFCLGVFSGCNFFENAAGPYVSGGIVQETNVVPKAAEVKEKQDKGDEIVYEIIDLDPDNSGEEDPFDDSVKYTYTADYDVVTGDADITVDGSDEIYTLTKANTMLVNAPGTAPFPYGTISCKVKSFNTCDSGIVFGYSSTTPGSFEGKGVYYYFYFIGQNGYAYLGRVYDGGWNALKVLKLPNAVDESHYYDLKVVFKGKKIVCYMDGELKFAIRDQNVLSGTGYGVRSAAVGVVFTDVRVTNEYEY